MPSKFDRVAKVVYSIARVERFGLIEDKVGLEVLEEGSMGETRGRVVGGGVGI